MKRASVVHSDPGQAIRSLGEQIKIPNQAALIFFCSAEYDPAVVSEECNRVFECPILGCSSAGEIGERYQTGGIVGLSLPMEHFTVVSRYISPLPMYTPQAASETVASLMSEIGGESVEGVFAFSLIDGLSVLEEEFVANTYGALPRIPLVGGSAGDNLKFEKTIVYCNRDFGGNSAVLSLIKTNLPFQTFELNHFTPSDKEMVTTEVDTLSRTVYEIDGGPAAEEYAKLLGLKVEDLTPHVFSAHPVMLQIGDEWYVRSIQKVNPDKSLTFFCAIEEGIPLSIGNGESFVSRLDERSRQLQENFDEVLLTLGCDCILRKLEIEQRGIQEEVEEILQKLRFIGFSTFGEQVNAIHVNQTLTGVVFGRR
ncbi:MAG: FIST C-terminal domain-containing protein [Bdellovibrionales bacterium]|nr:FIST C-terminal domain-containing protein [Bdellovibrionales bacterium]